MKNAYKLINDHKSIHSPCGDLREILSPSDYSPDIVVALDILPTPAHYHKGFDEIYFVLDGKLVLQIYEPGVKKASKKNHLCVIAVPNFDGNDEHKSEVI